MPINLDEYKNRITLADVKKLSKEKQDAIKKLCQTDLRFLANCVLRPNSKKFPPLVEKVHGKIMDAFPHTNPDVEWEEWDDRDEFVVLASRGMLKSTIGAAFLTQSILCYPDIRILIMSGILKKAKSILDIARKPFLTNEVIRYLFPEWAVEIEDTNAEEFTCPKRNLELNLRDQTMEIATFGSVKAGWHGELILLDDATNEINSSTADNCEKTYATYDDTDELIEPGGYRVFLGTKWLDEDLPEYIKKKGEEDAEKSGKITVSFFSLPAWTLKTDGSEDEKKERLLREKTGTLTPDDVILTWPEKLNSAFLFKRYRRNRIDFYKQYLLDASIEQARSFGADVLNRQTRPMWEVERIPAHDRTVVMFWDLAGVLSGRRPKSETDYSCGIVVVFQNSTHKMWVVDATLEHFIDGRDVANGIIRLYQKSLWWSMEGKVFFGMEDAMGARYLESQITDIARQQKVTLPSIMWFDTDKTPSAKNIRIALLASEMKNGMVSLCLQIPYYDDIKSQFERWSITAKRRKDDGPDCIALAWKNYKDLIREKSPESLKPSAPVIAWEPEIPQPVKEQEPDWHADEANNADIEWMKSHQVNYN